MTLTTRQEEGLRTTIERYKSGEKYTCIAGYAGTGKSVLVKFIIQALAGLGLDPESDICNIAPTGKAATLLSKKGNQNCMTFHKLVYKAYLQPNGRYIFEKRDFLDYRIVICDEASMLTQTMINQLLSFPGVYVIFCGDPFQLEPVDKSDASPLLLRPHVFLDEVMRQAKESEIIRLSMDIREGKYLFPFKGKEVQILRKKEFVTGMLTWSDITICATNNMRIALNSQTRELLGYTQPIEENERLIFLRNYWDILSEEGYALTNGVVGNLRDWEDTGTIYLGRYNQYIIPTIGGTFYNDNNESYGNIVLDKNCLLTGIPTLSDKDKYKLRKDKDLFPLEATYGYTATCWKFQGDQAEKVLGIEEKFPYGIEHQKYLYTLCTRAEKKLVLIKSE